MKIRKYQTVMQIFILMTVILLFMLPPGGGQRTYMRTCECEYMVDGKCAYTLLLPTGAANTPACEGGEGIPTDLEGSVWNRLDKLANNISQISLWSGDQARMLNSLQSTMISLQENTDELKIALQITSDAKNDENFAVLESQLQQHDNQIDTINDQVKALQDVVSTLSGEVSEIKNHTSTLSLDYEELERDLTQALDKVKRQEERIDALVETASQIDQRFRHMLCESRGLLVSRINQSIPDSAILTSSNFDASHGPDKARINIYTVPGAWCPSEEWRLNGEPNQPEEWIQLDLGSVKVIYSVATKGRSDYAQFVTTFKVQYSVDSTVDAETRWTTFTDVLDNEQIFEGNFDQDTLKVNDFWKPIQARIVRILPLQASGNRCMRVDFIGCLDDPITTN